MNHMKKFFEYDESPKSIRQTLRNTLKSLKTVKVTGYCRLGLLAVMRVATDYATDYADNCRKLE